MTTTTTSSNNNQHSGYIQYIQSSIEQAYKQTVRIVTGQPEQPEQQPTPLQSTLQFFHNHPKLTQAIAYPLALYSIKKLAQLVKKHYRQNTVLELDLTTITLSEKPVSPLQKLFTPNRVWYYDVIQALEYSAKDQKIVGLVTKLGGSSNDSGLSELGMGHVDELRQAIIAFSQKKQVSVCYADMIGDASSATKSTRQYYLATAFKEIYIVPVGMVIIPGLMLPGIFVKNTLEKLEIEPQLLSREEYKTAVNMFTQDKFTEPHREQVETILNDLGDKIASDIATARKVSLSTVKQWFDMGIMTPQQALDQGIIDGIAFRDEVYDLIGPKVFGTTNNKPNFLFLTSYLEKRGPMYENGNKEIALIFAEGPIQRGEEEPSIFDEETAIYSETLARQIRNAAKDKNVKAIVLRVNSPGGDAIASDIINREIVLAKKNGKKIVISMGSVAASGGYWISMNADYIVCNPLAITGSIGVIFGKLVVRDLMENKLGITFDEVHSHERSTITSALHRYNDDQWNVTNSLIDFYYDEFKKNVASGRRLDLDHVSRIAKGQVYLGERARSEKLVDRIGGLSDAIEAAKELILFNEEKGDKLQLTVYPKSKNLIQKLLSAKKAQNSEQRDKQASVFSLGIPASPAKLFSSFFPSAMYSVWRTVFGMMMNVGGVQSRLDMNILGDNGDNNSSAVMMKDPLVEIWYKNM